MGFHDAKGIWRSDGDGFYDARGNWVSPGGAFYDAKEYLRSPGDGFYDAKGNWVNPGEAFYRSCSGEVRSLEALAALYHVAPSPLLRLFFGAVLQGA